jgi:hypothetical protein
VSRRTIAGCEDLKHTPEVAESQYAMESLGLMGEAADAMQRLLDDVLTVRVPPSNSVVARRQHGLFLFDAKCSTASPALVQPSPPT